MRTALITAVVLLCLSVVTSCDVVGGGAPTATPTPKIESTIPISAKGVVRSPQQTKLSFRASGEIVALPKVGDRVVPNQEIASLASPDLDLAVSAAEDGVLVARALLEQVKAPPRSVDLAVLEAAYTAAQAQHNQLIASPSAADLDAARTGVTAAQAALDAANARRSALKSDTAKADLLAADSGIRTAEANLSAAKARLKALESGATADQKAASAAQVAQAKAALDLRKAGPTTADLAVLEARVRQAETALEQARTARRSAHLMAPASGVVVWVGTGVGEMAVAGVPVVQVADLSELVVETTDLDESSATKLTVGGAARVFLNALGETEVSGTVRSIAPLATTTPSGDAYYTVTVGLGTTPPMLRIGMTTRVDFVVDR